VVRRQRTITGGFCGEDIGVLHQTYASTKRNDISGAKFAPDILDTVEKLAQ
jgi:hypothetical protein